MNTIHMIFSRPRLNKNLTLLNSSVPQAAWYPSHLGDQLEVEEILLWEIIKILIRGEIKVIAWTFKSLPWRTYKDSRNTVFLKGFTKKTHFCLLTVNMRFVPKLIKNRVFLYSRVTIIRVTKKEGKISRWWHNVYFDGTYENRISGNVVKKVCTSESLLELLSNTDAHLYRSRFWARLLPARSCTLC